MRISQFRKAVGKADFALIYGLYNSAAALNDLIEIQFSVESNRTDLEYLASVIDAQYENTCVLLKNACKHVAARTGVDFYKDLVQVYGLAEFYGDYKGFKKAFDSVVAESEGR